MGSRFEHIMVAGLLASAAGCGGEVEDEACQATAWLDADGDGFGDPLERVCPDHVDAVDNGDDCDDADATRYPGAEEVPYDGVDQDCDGEDLVDVDGDGYDAEQVGGTDCDDQDPSVHPGAPDDDGDGIDNDCDGFVDEELGGGTSEQYGGPAGSLFGYSMLPPDDYLGDGVPVTLVGAPRAGDATGTGGCVFWLDPGSLAPVEVWCHQEAQRLAGTSAAAGDVDGDGRPDVILGAPGTGFGVVLVMAGPLEPGSAPMATIYGDGEDRVGHAVSPGGYRGGAMEVLVGAFGKDEGKGELWVYREPAGDLGRGDADLVISGEHAGAWVGRSSMGSLDLDGDGLSDLVVGGYGDSTGGAAAGAVWIFPGSGPGSGHLSVDDAPVMLYGRAAGHHVGVSLAAAGDLDGDGLPELVIGAPGHGAGAAGGGAVLVVPGGALTEGALNIHDVATLVVVGSMDDQRIGQAMVAQVDLDGGGVADLVISSPDNGTGAEGGGAAWIFLGEDLPGWSPATITVDDAWRFLEGTHQEGWAGRALVAGEGWDGLPCLLVAAPQAGEGGLVHSLSDDLMIRPWD